MTELVYKLRHLHQVSERAYLVYLNALVYPCATMPKVLVVGASRGLGLALAKELQTRTSTTVVATVRSTTPLESIDTLTDVDIASDTSITKAAQHPLVQKFDIIIINAAIGGLDALLASSPSVLESYLATNVIGPHRVVSAFLPALRRGREKKIIFISSSAGSFKIAESPTRMVRSGVYSVSKAALNMLAVQYADELKEEGFVVVPVHPGELRRIWGPWLEREVWSPVLAQ